MIERILACFESWLVAGAESALYCEVPLCEVVLCEVVVVDRFLEFCIFSPFGVLSSLELSFFDFYGIFRNQKKY